jgi:AraC-like DNA-binding protein
MAGFRDIGRTPADLRLIPHPAVTVAVLFGGGSVVVQDAAGRQRQGSLVAGLGFTAARMCKADAFACVQVRLSPLIVRAVLGVGPADLDGAVVSLDDLWGRDAARLAERLDGVAAWPGRFALTEALVARRCAAGPAVEPEVAWAWRRIVAGRGRVRVDGLAAELGWSRRRLWSRFQAQIGLPPKRAARLVRFDRAAHRLAAGQDAARVAADGGYADQSHLHRDVVAFTGVTPATVATEPFLAVDAVAWPVSRA